MTKSWPVPLPAGRAGAEPPTPQGSLALGDLNPSKLTWIIEVVNEFYQLFKI